MNAKDLSIVTRFTAIRDALQVLYVEGIVTASERLKCNKRGKRWAISNNLKSK